MVAKYNSDTIQCIHNGTLPVTGGSCFIKGERGRNAVHPECLFASLKEDGWEIVKFYTRADLYADEELADNLSMITEDGLFIKESL